MAVQEFENSMSAEPFSNGGEVTARMKHRRCERMKVTAERVLEIHIIQALGLAPLSR